MASTRVRDLVFGSGFDRPLGGHYIAVTQALRHGLPLSRHAYMGDGRMVNLFPVTPNSVSAVVYVGEDAGRPPRHDAVAMRGYLLETCAGFPDEVHRVFDAINAGSVTTHKHAPLAGPGFIDVPRECAQLRELTAAVS